MTWGALSLGWKAGVTDGMRPGGQGQHLALQTCRDWSLVRAQCRQGGQASEGARGRLQASFLSFSAGSLAQQETTF